MSACDFELMEPNNSTRWAACKSFISFLDLVKAIRLTMRVWIFLILAGICLAEQERNDRSKINLYIAFFSGYVFIFKKSFKYFEHLKIFQMWLTLMYLLLMPNPSASSNIFWPCSNIFDRVQYFLNVFKHFWPCSNM